MESRIERTEIIRSSRRRKTVSARVRDGVLVVYVPARFSEAEARRWAERMRSRVLMKLERDELNAQDDLERRTERLNRQFFEGRLSYQSIRYVTNQRAKFGSCSPGSREIRISHRLARMPAFVLEYVIVHELAHLLEPNHGVRFWRLVRRFPHAERAIGFLMGVGFVPARERMEEEPTHWIPDETTEEASPIG